MSKSNIAVAIPPVNLPILPDTIPKADSHPIIQPHALPTAPSAPNAPPAKAPSLIPLTILDRLQLTGQIF